MILASLILAAALHAGPEQALAPAVPESQPYDQLVSAAAAGTDTALVVWLDTGESTFHKEVHAARIDRDGTLLDTRPLILSVEEAISPPAVAHGNDRWLVVWSEDSTITACTVLDDGTVGEKVRISEGGQATVAFDGAQFVAVWQNQSFMRAARFDASGKVIESPIDIAGFMSFANLGPLVRGPEGLVLLVQRASSIETFVLDHEARVRDQGTIVSGEDVFSGVCAAFDGDTLVVGWTAGNYSARLVRAGETPRTLATPMAFMHDLVFAGGRMHALFEHDEDLVLRSIDGSDERVWDVALDTGNARAASFGDRALIAASVGRYPYHDLYATVIDGALRDVAPPRLVTEEPRVQMNAAVAHTANSALAAWLEWFESEGRFVIMAALLDPFGRPLSAPFRVADEVKDYSQVEIATNGTDYLVAWITRGDMVTARRVLANGSMPDKQTIAQAFGHRACAAWTGSEYILGYVHYITSTRWTLTTEVRAARVNDAGVVETITVSPRDNIRDVHCAASRESTLFTWRRPGNLLGALVTRGGSVTSPFILGGDASASDLASNGENFVVAWFASPNMERVTVSSNGTVTRPFVPTIPAGPMLPWYEHSVSVGMRDDGGYVLAWGSQDIFAVPLGSNGNVIGPLLDVTTSIDDRFPAVDGNLIVYQRETGAPTTGHWRVFARPWLDAPPKRRVVR